MVDNKTTYDIGMAWGNKVFNRMRENHLDTVRINSNQLILQTSDIGFTSYLPLEWHLILIKPTIY